MTAAEAVKHAKANRVPSYEGKAGWSFVLYDVRSDTTVNEMGGFTFYPEDADHPGKPYIELVRYQQHPPPGRR